jgi:hypothetical protein
MMPECAALYRFVHRSSVESCFYDDRSRQRSICFSQQRVCGGLRICGQDVAALAIPKSAPYLHHFIIGQWGFAVLWRVTVVVDQVIESKHSLILEGRRTFRPMGASVPEGCYGVLSCAPGSRSQNARPFHENENGAVL